MHLSLFAELRRDVMLLAKPRLHYEQEAEWKYQALQERDKAGQVVDLKCSARTQQARIG